MSREHDEARYAEVPATHFRLRRFHLPGHGAPEVLGE
jgi:hypothetical protein